MENLTHVKTAKWSTLKEALEEILREMLPTQVHSKGVQQYPMPELSVQTLKFNIFHP